MYNLLICDDEWMIREQISRTAQKMGGFIVHTAESGLAALELLAHQPIDGIVLDVRMPEMDGITLLKQLRIQRKDPVVIILSGHDEFDYAQQSLRYGAVEYLLKPVTEAQIKDFLSELRERIRRKRTYVAKIHAYRQELDHIKPILREQFFRDILQKSLNQSAVQQMEQLLNLRIQYPYIAAAVIDVRMADRDCPDDNNPLQHYAVGELLESHLRTQINATLFHTGSDGMTILAGSASETLVDDLTNAMEHLLTTLADDLSMRFYIGIGSTVRSVDQIRNSYAQALYALSCNDFEQEIGIVNIHDVEDENPRDIGTRDLRSSLREIWAANATTNGQETISKLRNLLSQMQQRSDIDLDTAIYYCSYFAVIAMDRLEQRQEFLSQNPIFEIASQTSLSNLYRSVGVLMNKVEQSLKTNKQSRIRWLADACKAIIERDYSSKIGIQEIADSLGVSRNYLSTVFRRETDYSVIEYLNAVRLQRAKHLLRDTNHKVYEIAELVGFSDTYYFSSVFKKHIGVSPSDYRDSLL